MVLIIKTIQLKEFCKKSNLNYSDEIKLFEANRNNANSKNKPNLIIHIDNLQDFMKQKNSAIDEVFCKFAREKDKKIFFDLNELLNSKNQGLLVQRIKQNIMLLKKYKLKYDFIYICENVKDVTSEKDISALMKVLESKQIDFHSL